MNFFLFARRKGSNIANIINQLIGHEHAVDSAIVVIKNTYGFNCGDRFIVTLFSRVDTKTQNKTVKNIVLSVVLIVKVEATMEPLDFPSVKFGFLLNQITNGNLADILKGCCITYINKQVGTLISN